MTESNDVDDIQSKSEKCSNFLRRMCSDRTKENRNCAMSKCCGICYKVIYCEGVCKYLKDNFKELNNNSNK